MADTTAIALNDSSWTDVSAVAGVTGFMTNVGPGRVTYIESLAVPNNSDTVGHRLMPGASINYDAPTSTIYARTKRGNGRIAVTGS